MASRCPPRAPAPAPAGRHQGHRARARHLHRHRRSRPARQARCQRRHAGARARAWPRRSAIGRISPRAFCSRASSCASRSTCRGGSRCSGIRCAKASAKPRRRSRPALHVDFRAYPRLGDGDIPLFEEALRDGTERPDHRARAIRPRSRRTCARPRGATSRSSASSPTRPKSLRLTSVSADPFTVGAVAGELLARFLPGGGEVAFFTGWLAMQDHADKLRGFESSLSAIGARLTLGPIVEAHDDEREGHRRALQRAARASGPEGDLRQHGELAAGAARRRGGRAPRRADRRDDGPVSRAGRVDSRRQGRGDGLSAAGEPGPPGAAGALPVSAARHAPAFAPARRCRIW